ncbi:hypothetical protein [Alteribacillus bidgolensis]|nr:hypothetical protein [Alteribacillus bidgolensis]
MAANKSILSLSLFGVHMPNKANQGFEGVDWNEIPDKFLQYIYFTKVSE